MVRMILIYADLLPNKMEMGFVSMYFGRQLFFLSSTNTILSYGTKSLNFIISITTVTS